MWNTIDSLESLIAAVPIIKAAIPVDASIAVCDLEKFLAYFPGETVDLRIRVNQELQHDEPLAAALRQNQALHANVPAELYGFEFTGTAVPLHDRAGKVIGGIAVQLRR